MVEYYGFKCSSSALGFCLEASQEKVAQRCVYGCGDVLAKYVFRLVFAKKKYNVLQLRNGEKTVDVQKLQNTEQTVLSYRVYGYWSI